MKEIGRRTVSLGTDASAALIEYRRETKIIATSAGKISTWRFRLTADAEAWAAYYASHQVMPYAFPPEVPRPFDATIQWL